MAKWRAVTFIAVKDMFQDKRIVALVIFVLALSFVNVVFFASFINGFGETFQEEIINTASGHIVIEPPIDEPIRYLDFEESIRKKIDVLPEVVGTTSRMLVPGTITFENREVSAPIIGVDPEEEERVSWLHKQVQEGSFLSNDDAKEIVIGRDLAGYKQGEGKVFFQRRGLDVDAGETVHLIFSNGYEADYHVKGIIGKPFGDVTRTAYISYEEAERITNQTGKASQVLVKLTDKKHAPYYKSLIAEQVIRNADIKTWDEFLAVAEIIKRSYDVVVYIMTVVGILVAFTTIAVVTYISTRRKRRGIAVLRAIGAPKSMIVQVFLVESMIFGIIGILAGLGISHAVTYYLEINPIITGIGPVTPVLTSGIITSACIVLFISIVIASIYPSWKASREKILEQIRQI